MKKEDSIDALRQLLGGAPDTRKLHYTFAYEGFPGQFFAGTDLMWPVLKKADINVPILKKIWAIVGQMANLSFLEPEGLRTDFRESDQFEIVTIIMPTPKYIPEAYYCIILKNKATSIFQYYTVEYGGAEKIVLGSVFSDGTRQSEGNINDSNLDNCINKILALQS